MNQEIIINKEGEGDVFEMLQESSDDSSIDVQQPTKRSTRKIVANSQRNTRKPVSRTQPIQQQPRVETPLTDSMFEVFTNPDKTRPPESDDEIDTTVNNDDEIPAPVPDEFEPSLFNDDEIPSQGFQTIEDEKQDLIYKFYRLQSKGVPVSRKFNVHSDIKEMRNEYERIKRDMEINSSIRFSRRMLMACITGIEFLNKRYDPFDFHLEGWSESVIENVTDYDNVFERLHDKYSSKIAMAPEIELLLSLAGSAFMFHLTNAMFSSAMPNLRDVAQQNPDIIKNMMQSMAMASGPPKTEKNNDEPTKDNDNNNDVREMKPPAFDIHSIISNSPFAGVGNNTFEATRNTDINMNRNTSIVKNNYPQKFSPPASINLSDNDSDSHSVQEGGATRTISLNSETQVSKGGTRRKRGKKISMNDQNSITI